LANTLPWGEIARRRGGLPGMAALHWELQHLVEAGLKPLDVLRMATADAATAVGADGYLGKLAPGMLVDIVLLEADPLTDVRNTEAIWRVIKGGWVFDPKELRPAARNGG
jgi:imidazolonepropionase-like amidohydrolase